METIDSRLFYELYPSFNWEYYLRLYPDVVNAGFITEQQTIRHYMLHGRYENRIYSKPIVDNTREETPVLYDMTAIRNKQVNVSDALDMLGFSKEATILRNNTKK